MKNLPIPKEKLLTSIFNFSLYELLKEYVADPSIVDIRNYVTVNRKDISDYLNSNPTLADDYLQRYKETKTLHDIYTIDKHGENYRVYWLDHGKPRFIKKFKSISEAVVDHVMIELGIS